MAGRNYPRLTIEEFGRQLLESGDLDPIYLAVHRMGLRSEQLKKWLIAYWCFYSAGVACWMSEQDDQKFWAEMKKAALNEEPAPHGGRWERGKERRHFRGSQSFRAVAELADRYPRPGGMVDFLSESELSEHETILNGSEDTHPEKLPFCVVADRTKTHRGFGEWISFKVADMLERVGGVPIKFEIGDAMYDQPTRAAEELYNLRHPDLELGVDGTPMGGEAEKILDSILHLEKTFQGCVAQPLMDRPLGLQEFETILCKWKSHRDGHYPLLNDIHEIEKGILPWSPVCGTALKFQECMP